MHHLQRPIVAHCQVDTSRAGAERLLEERTESGASLVVYESVVDEAKFIASLFYFHAEVYILTIAHGGKASDSVEHVMSDSHAVAARVERVHLAFAATAYAASGEERSHGVGYGLLDGGEETVSLVARAEAVHDLGLYVLPYLVEEIGRQGAVGIEEKEIFAGSVLRPSVTCRSRSSVGLGYILDVELVSELVNSFLACYRRAVLDHYDLRRLLEVLDCQRV